MCDGVGVIELETWQLQRDLELLARRLDVLEELEAELRGPARLADDTVAWRHPSLGFDADHGKNERRLMRGVVIHGVDRRDRERCESPELG